MAHIYAPEEAPDPDVEAPDPSFWGPDPRFVRGARGTLAPPARREARVVERFESLRDRFGASRFEVGFGVVAVVLVALVAGVIWYRMGAGGAASAPPIPRASGVERTASSASAQSASAATVPQSRSAASPMTVAGTNSRGTAARGAVTVHVAGSVRTPGVLALPAGARVIDAIEGAGGGLPDADLDRLNLAAKLIDGQRILVTKIGAPVAGLETAVAGAASDAAPIDLNNATGAQLETLPGIGPSLAAAIIAERDRRGGFRSINELREVRGIGEKRFADLRDHVMV